MKTLSIRQPWAWAILNAGKRVENRDWKHAPSYRGPLLIHAAKGCTRDEYLDAGEGMVDAGLVEYIDERAEMIESRVQQGLSQPGRILPRLADLQRGGIVGRANLVDIVKNSGGGHGWTSANVCCRCGATAVSLGLGASLSTCSKPDPWDVPGAVGLLLADVVALPFAPLKGMLGLFEVSDEELAAATEGATS